MKRFIRKYLSEQSIAKINSFRTNGESFVQIVERIADFYDKNVILIVPKKEIHHPGRPKNNPWDTR